MTRLPDPKTKGKVTVEEAILARRSVRSFADRPLDRAQIAQLAWAAQGVTEEATGYRAAPSAGALFPLELYLVTRDGTYRYVPDGHGLEDLTEQDLRTELARAALHQYFLAEAPLDVVICAVYERCGRKYGRRANRYVDMEAGHAAQNIMLQAIALGLSSVAIGAFDDAAVKTALRLPPDHDPILIVPVGYQR